MRSPPSVLPRVCVGPSSSPLLGRVNISWDPLPCHLQNGADIADDYTIQYTSLSPSVTRTTHDFHSEVQCSQEIGGLYSCVLAESLFLSNQSYSFQVAVRNDYGEGSFSDPINVSLPVSSRWSCTIIIMTMMLADFYLFTLTASTCTNSSNVRDYRLSVASTSSTSITATSSEAFYSGITSVFIDTSLDANLASLSSLPVCSCLIR